MGFAIKWSEETKAMDTEGQNNDHLRLGNSGVLGALSAGLGWAEWRCPSAGAEIRKATQF